MRTGSGRQRLEVQAFPDSRKSRRLKGVPYLRSLGGQDVTFFSVDGNGTVHANGGFRPFGADLAESVAVNGSTERYSPGDLLVVNPSGERRLSLSQTPYSTLVAGIYSTQPGVVASTHRIDEALPNNEVPLAIVGSCLARSQRKTAPSCWATFL